MSDERGEVQRNTQADMERLTLDQSRIQNAVAISSNVQFSSPILKLDVDCFEDLFEWLSLADLRSLRRMCKRLKQVVDYFIKTHYPAVKMGYGRIELHEDKIDQFQQLHLTSVEMIKEAKIYFNEITVKEIDVFKGILPQVERLKINTWQLSANEGNFYESILKWCSNLKYLSIDLIHYAIIGEDNEWLKQQCPTIEHVAMDDNDVGGPGMAGVFPDLKTFFELNPNIQTFSTTFHLLRINGNVFLGSNVKVDQLNVYGDCFHEYGMNVICELLNQLHDQGFYQRLHMEASYITLQEELDLIISVRGMEKLYLDFCSSDKLTLAPKPEIKELGISYVGDYIALDAVAKSLMNVERVCIGQGKVEEIIPFLRYARKVKEIKVGRLDEGAHFENGVIDLPALNKERKGLAGASKITIYVHEDVFLATKMALMKTDFSLVTLKRAEAVEWIHQLRY
ncbi:uncharacterized protein LOC129565347 isoform X1 [Sitodiplosis mosellana]|uniref:uncharacterized protein LOC129565347 isoform X1 n=1 Tax=Sitodiplosis mosellana TaxID=263140 RepID=UPI00244491EB|nr:uncharacterized protein LOC129565347 isoform X1 [Sitodiplosis mosellana]